MITRSKILTILMAVLLLATGAVYAQGSDGAMDQENGTEMMEEQGEYKAGLLYLEDLLNADPKLKDLAEEYQTKLDEIKASNSEDQEAQIKDLKTEYTALSLNQTEADFTAFAEEFGLEILVVNETAVYNPKELDPQNITEFENMNSYFKSYLNNETEATDSESDSNGMEDTDPNL